MVGVSVTGGCVQRRFRLRFFFNLMLLCGFVSPKEKNTFEKYVVNQMGPIYLVFFVVGVPLESEFPRKASSVVDGRHDSSIVKWTMVCLLPVVSSCFCYGFEFVIGFVVICIVLS